MALGLVLAFQGRKSLATFGLVAFVLNVAGLLFGQNTPPTYTPPQYTPPTYTPPPPPRPRPLPQSNIQGSNAWHQSHPFSLDSQMQIFLSRQQQFQPQIRSFSENSNKFFSTVSRVPNIARTIEVLERTQSVHEAANDKVAQAIGHSDLAALYVKSDKLDRAFQQIAAAERIAVEINDPKLQADVIVRDATVYMASGEFEQAILEYRRALQILRSVGDEKGRAEAYAAVGWAYESLGKPLDALGCYEASLYLFQELHDKDGEVRVRIGRG